MCIHIFLRPARGGLPGASRQALLRRAQRPREPGRQAAGLRRDIHILYIYIYTHTYIHNI